ncbi:MAG TPA: HDOD domain-containing protein [Planctomycetota bacterium]|nr:HDOD domain-containing protein [Planctomycetota bacterium]
MADDLFGNQRFKPAPTKAAVDDDSGKDYRTQSIGKTIQVGEAELLAEVDRIPALPAVVQKILTLAGSMSSTAMEMEELIRQDMVIAGRLLKLVNSPFYGLSKSVSSISQAVSIVGFSSLKSLVMAASASNLMMVDLTCYGFKSDGLWKNSIVTAMLARDIARRCGVDKDEAEEYFLAGLMRDVGMLVLGPILAKNRVTLRKISGNKDDILTRERRAIGFDHCWAGERVADKWRLPADLLLSIGKHHRIPSLLSDQQMKRLATIRLAERLAYAAGAGVGSEHPFEIQIDGVLLQAVGLSATLFQTFMLEAPGIVAKADKSLQ